MDEKRNCREVRREEITSESSHTYHTHTHTHVGFPCFMRTFHRHNYFYTVNVSCILSPNPKPTHGRKFSAFLHLQKSLLSMIYKLISIWGPKICPHKDKDFKYLPFLWGHTHTQLTFYCYGCN